MDARQLAGRLSEAMDLETKLLESLADSQRRAQAAAGERDLAGLEQSAGQLNHLSAQLANVEDKRDRLFRSLLAARSLPPDTAPLEAFATLPEPERGRLIRSRVGLSHAAAAASGQSGRLHHALATVADAMRTVIDELFPYRRGAIYSGAGRRLDVPDQAVLVNRTF